MRSRRLRLLPSRLLVLQHPPPTLLLASSRDVDLTRQTELAEVVVRDRAFFDAHADSMLPRVALVALDCEAVVILYEMRGEKKACELNCFYSNASKKGRKRRT